MGERSRIMKEINKKDFLKKSCKTLEDMLDMLSNLPELELKHVNKDKTVLVIVDMINGFAKEGALSSPRVEGIIPEITELMNKCDKLSIPKVAFADSHTSASPEFDSYPVHCMTGTYESEIVSEIKNIGGYTLIPKNSTNGFLEEKFQQWLKENEHIDTFIITGDCTDICIQQFAETLKTWFNMKNMKSRIIVPINAVETYDLEMHDGDLTNVMALYNMIINGVEVVKKVE